jgi:Dna[CI] antecedent DciA-like protein
MTSESVSKLLGDNAELRPLAARLEQIRRLQRRYRTLAPERLAESSRVCAIDGTTVVICADSGPVAAALRHLAPRLLEGLRSIAKKSAKHPRDQELTSLRIEVQVDNPQPKRPVRGRGELPVDKLSKVAGSLSDSPLKSELERIAKSDQARRTRSKT